MTCVFGAEDEHFGHADFTRALVTEHGVCEAIAYENLVDSGGFCDFCKGEVVSGDHGNHFVLGFFRLDIFWS